MRGFLLGFLCAAALVAGGYFLALPRLPGARQVLCRACRGDVEAGPCVAAPAPTTPPPKRRLRRTGRPQAQEGAGGEAEARPQVVLKPAELKAVTTGDNLTQTEVIDLTKSGGGERELDDEAIDAVFRPAQAAIIACVDEARGDAQLSGRMTVSFRLGRSGAVSGVRLEAPAYLVQHGLYGCVRPLVSALRFPPSSRGQVVSYPFTLR